MVTPLIRITYKYKNNIKHVVVKNESVNITGSIKYRPAKNIIDKAYELHLLTSNQRVIEVTSGNMGIALAEALKRYKNKLTIYMPEFMSEERKSKLKDYGATLILTKSFKEAFELASKDKDAFYVKQFENQFNAESYKSLVDEITPKLNNIPAFISGVGTGGTLNGIGHILKNKYHSKIIAVDPKESMLLMTGTSQGQHEIEGLSDGFIPDLYPKDIVDEIIPIASVDAIRMSQKIKDELGIGVGISSGANLLGAILTNIDDIFTVFPDNVDRYYSTRLFDKSIKSELVDQIKLLSFETL